MSIELYDQTRKYFLDLIDHFYVNGGDFETSIREAKKAAERAGFTNSDMVEIMLERWVEKIEDALSDGVLTKQEDRNLNLIAHHLDTRTIEVGDHNHSHMNALIPRVQELIDQMKKLSTIRRLRDGELDASSFDGLIPFKLQNGEIPIWKAEDVTLREFVKERSVKGQSFGVSIRVAKGVYVRPSAFSAAPQQKESLKDVDKGTVILTSKHITFDGAIKHFKIRLTSLANIQPFSDGLELQKNTQTARPFFLFPFDGWFFYNCIQAV
ncbi:MAG: hypothetical protein CMO55_24985 [Verrucomicrobiales bacterium]|nr:hypothetical protein [Verrucomicrobiales bacterium]